MIKDNQIIKVKIEKRTLEHYSKFINDKNKTIEIEAKYLHPSSRKKIDVECDICHKENNILFVSYYNNMRRGGYYTCSTCKWIKIKKTKKKKYGDEYYHNIEKSKKTNLEKYGCENVSGSQLIKDRKKETNLKNWGVENVFQNEEIKNKLKKTCLEKYGVEHPLQNEYLLKKSNDTCFLNNGVKYPTQSKKVIEKRKENNLEKYGVEHYTQTEKYKSDVLLSNNEKYDSDWYMGSNNFKEKSKITNLFRYGVEYNMQNEDIYTKAQINGHKAKRHHTNLFYRGTYEKDFLDYCFDNNIKVEKGKRFSYTFENKNRYYFSDYFISEKNLIVEIKSSYYYSKYLQMNKSKQKSALDLGYNFIFIVDKNYNDFDKLIK